jgi:hypothetical protein
MSESVLISINAQLAERDVKAATGLENKIKAAMRAVLRENWMDTNDDSMMRAALAAVMLDVGKESEDYQRIVSSVEALRKFSAFLNAAQAGLSVDITSALPAEDAEPPLPFVKWWHEAKAAK